MKNISKGFAAILVILTIFTNCKKNSYSLGSLTPPANVSISAVPVGKDATHPNGDSSGNVMITVNSDYALSYKVDYDTATPVDMVYIPTGTVTHKYTVNGLHTYTITAIVYGKGGSSTTATTNVTVYTKFVPSATIVTNLTGNATKKWAVDQSVPGHLGVGPWSATSTTSEWWSAGVNEKVSCCNCFYTASFSFTKVSETSFSLQVATPTGAFTKTGNLTTLPGIPAAGDEGCYSYSGGSSSFTFIPSNSGITSSASTHTSILLSGNNTFIGYGATLKEYEILSISATAMYLRVQGTETGNAWYIKLKAL